MKETSQVKISRHLHEKMKEVADKNGNSITDEYEKIIKEHIKSERQKEIERDSQIEIFLNKKMNAIDKHLSSILINMTKDINTLLFIEFLKTDKKLREKYSNDEIIKYYEKQGEYLYKQRMKQARDIKKVKEDKKDDWSESD